LELFKSLADKTQMQIQLMKIERDKMKQKINSLTKRFKREESGAIAIEFAFIFPLLILIYFGIVEMGNALAASRKVTLLTGTVADIVAQYDEISKSDLDKLFLATTEILRPFEANSSNLRIEVFSITVDDDDAQVQSWPGKVSNGGTCGDANAPAPTVPADILANKGSVIVAKVCYKYDSILHRFFATDPSFNEVFFVRPRRVDAISWQAG
jgi:Flp pilus assembly protein TadG